MRGLGDGVSLSTILHIIQPDPRSQVRLVPVEEAIHLFSDIQRYALKPRMIHPMLRRIQSQGEVPNLDPVNTVVFFFFF
jgi:hypothetical protein